MENPDIGGSEAKRNHKIFTPVTGRINLKTPRTKRVTASVHRHHAGDSDCHMEQTFQDLLGRQWNIHSLSPLYNFKYGPDIFKQYARSLDVAFTQAQRTNFDSSTTKTRSSIEVYPGLKFHPDDHEAIKIQVTERNPIDGKESVIFRAVLLCVDMEKSILPSHQSAQFCYFPVVIVSGNKARASVLLNWLEQHFDCRTSPLTLTHSDLQWLLAVGCSKMQCEKKMDVLLQYDVSKACTGINTMNCNLEFDFCQDLWNRLNENSQPREVVTEDEVKAFFTSIEHHVQHTMHIYVTKLTLREVGSPMAYVSSKGKFKMFFHPSIYLTLHLICDIAWERFTLFYQSQP